MVTGSMVTPSRFPTEIIDFVHDTQLDDLPEDVVGWARRCVLDLLGVAAAGRSTELSAIIHDHAARHFGAGEGPSASMIFDGRAVSPAGAALAGGMTIDSIDAHDGHKITKGHTGCHQLPALLALTEAEGRDDAGEFLTALIVGYEFATRAGIALHATAPDYHTSGAWGSVGVAALGARVLDLSPAKTWEAMGIGEYHGPRSQMMRVIDHPTMLKDGSGWGAMAGVSAAYLAADGFTGAPAITVCDPAVEHVWSDLGERWVIFDQYFKPYPVCRWAQPAVEAALSVCQGATFESEQVASIQVTTFHEAARLATALPATTEHAQYSLPFPVAAAVARGRLGATEVTAESLADPELRRLAAAVTIDEDPAHNAAFPGNRFARVVVELVDGRRYESEDHEPRGDPEDHLDDAEIRAKFHRFADPVLGATLAARIESAVDRLGSGDSLGNLRSLISAGASAPMH
ncbi:MAG: MmgE/PrpD family protein [Actinomycetota bacterium]